MMKLMSVMLFSGLLLSGMGVYLLVFTTLANEGGMRGIFMIVILITLGLLFLIPAKIYIIISLMKRETTARSLRQKQ